MELQALIDQYGNRKKEANLLYSKYKDMQVELGGLQQELQAKLIELGFKSIKSERYTVSRSSRPTIIVEHEQSVIDWIKNSPEIEEDAYIGLKLTPFKTMALALLKDTGELASGTTLEMKESLSIREAKSNASNS